MIKHARFVILYRNLTDDGATAAFPSPHKAHSILISYIYRTRQKRAYGRQGLAGRIRARILFKWALFGVFSTSLFAPPTLSSDILTERPK